MIKILNDFPNYSINLNGEIINLKTNYKVKKRIKKGYYVVSLKNKDNKYKTLLLHRLLMITFNPIDNYQKLTIDHLNCNKLDNSIKNLQWVTSKENTHRAIKNNLYKDNRTFIEDDIVIKIRKEYIPGYKGNRIQLMKKYNIKKSIFYYIINDQFRIDLPLAKNINPYLNGEKNNNLKGKVHNQDDIEFLKKYFETPKKERKFTLNELVDKLKISSSTIYNIKKKIFG